MTAGDWAALPDSGAAEGLPPPGAGREARRSLEEFPAGQAPALDPGPAEGGCWCGPFWELTWRTGRTRPHLQVLGFNARDRELLKAMKAQAASPILTKPAHAGELAEPGGGCSPWRPDAPISV